MTIDLPEPDRGVIRRRNLITKAEMPYRLARVEPLGIDTETDSGDYAMTLDRCLEEIGWVEKAGTQGNLIGGRYRGTAVGCYLEGGHHSSGSGSVFARGALKKLWRPGLDEEAAVAVALEALYDAADDDSATGGPDLGRQIWPTVAVVDRSGAHFVSEDDLESHVAAIVESRRGNPGGAR